MEECERRCVEEGVDPRCVKFVCSIALHRFIRPDEFRHICGDYLYDKYSKLGATSNYNAVDEEHSVVIGRTELDEEVKVCKDFAEADMLIYANCNYVAMDGGYKSYATGLVHYTTLRYNHDSETLKKTRSLMDPARSSLHASIIRIGKVMQKHTDVFHVETVLDDNRFPFYLRWVQILFRRMNWIQKAMARISCFFLRFLPNWLRLWIFWGPLVRGQFGLVQCVAGETEACACANFGSKLRRRHRRRRTGRRTCSSSRRRASALTTKDTYLNPLLVNTYALGYYYNMYVEGIPLLRQGGAMIVVNPMPYQWTEPTHTAYKAIFEEAVAPLGPTRFEEQQERFATDEALNDIYRKGLGPAAVHGFYMYTWAAHGMEKVGKVFVVGAVDARGSGCSRVGATRLRGLRGARGEGVAEGEGNEGTGRDVLAVSAGRLREGERRERGGARAAIVAGNVCKKTGRPRGN